MRAKRNQESTTFHGSVAKDRMRSTIVVTKGESSMSSPTTLSVGSLEPGKRSAAVTEGDRAVSLATTLFVGISEPSKSSVVVIEGQSSRLSTVAA
jgi:hypothetical protein